MWLIDTRVDCLHGIPLQAWCSACSDEIDEALRRRPASLDDECYHGE